MRTRKTNWVPTIIAIFIAFVIICLAFGFRNRIKEGFSNSDELYLVMFKADWCPHCKNALPKYKELMASMNGAQVGASRLYFDIIDPELESERVNVSIVDKAMEIEVKSQYSLSKKVMVTGFPTYMLYGRSGGPVRYTGALDRESVLAFLA